MITGRVQTWSRPGAAVVATLLVGWLSLIAPTAAQAQVPYPAPIVTSVAPKAGCVGDTVVVTGENFFDRYTGVVFDDLLAPIFPQTINDAGTTITFPVPDIGVGPHTLLVTTDGQTTPRYDFTILDCGTTTTSSGPSTTSTTDTTSTTPALPSTTVTTAPPDTGSPIPTVPAPSTTTTTEAATDAPVLDSISPTSGPAGTEITVTGSNLEGAELHIGDETVPLTLDPARISISSGHATVPADLPPGRVAIFLVNSVGESAHETFNVTEVGSSASTTPASPVTVAPTTGSSSDRGTSSSSGSDLARTGIDADSLAALGLVVILTGLVLTAATRRRRT